MASLYRPRPSPLRRSALGAAAWLCCLGAPAWSQEAAPASSPAPSPAAEVVTITGRAAAPAVGISGFGEVPAARAPFQALSISNAMLADAGLASLADITRLDAGIGDAYNAPGYWSALTVRGFILDNRFNYRRDGLPINAETAISLANKERVEILKGTSGAQAGTSAPGGLANVVVKRPLPENRRSVLLGWKQDGSLQAATDINQRFGADGAAGLRLNAAAERLDPTLAHSRGERYLLAAAGEARLSPDSLLEAEIEWSRQSQPSAPGFSMLGSVVPSAKGIDPDLNLNNQPWALPVVFEGTTASLRWTRNLGNQWRVIAHGMAQELRTDDRIAFPFGCSAENTYDRYCSDGSFDLYDFRSEGERRHSLAAAFALEGEATTGPLHHQLSTGVTWSRYRARLGRQAYNYSGTGNISGDYEAPAAPELTDENTNRTERSTELHLRDAIKLSEPLTLWAGLRHSQLVRDSVRTDGSRATHYDQSFTTPWLALSYQLSEAVMAYASWGEGVESDVAPNRSFYTNAGQPLPALKSRQWEIGLKGETRQAGWSLTAFDIRRPLAVDACVDDGSCTRQIDGNARHRGIEASADTRQGAWDLRASAMWLKARREGAANPADNGLTPTNVAERTLKLQTTYRVAALPGLSLLGYLSYEGQRMVLPDNSARIPGWTRVDLASRYTLRAAGHDLTLRLGLDNAFDRRAWKESPYQFGHAYLYPLAPRTWRASIQADL
ncbi:MAG TPA: TonB-dependent siderophore receptor [Ideonella sp.]|nr:TonB-dependent siderophore receptor [Ideonella sp.]